MLNLNRKQKGYLSIALLSIIGLTLIILPANYFDEGQSLCLSVILLNKQCYACGMTRAVQHIIHFDFATAASYNKLAFIVVPLGIFMTLKEIYERFFKNNNTTSNSEE
jgi:hypothetical protein